MKRIGKCLKFELYYLGRVTLGFLGSYFVIYFTIMCLALLSPKVIVGGSFNSSFAIAGAIFTFIFITTSYKMLFNNLLLFGNTRKNIMISSFVAYFALSVVTAAVSVMSAYLEGTLVRSNVNFFNALYPQNVNAATEFIWFLAFFVFISICGMLHGSLSYKFGRVFKIIFWVGISFIIMFLPLLIDLKAIVNILSAVFRVGSTNGIFVAPLNMLAATVILGAITWLAVRRQPQNA